MVGSSPPETWKLKRRHCNNQHFLDGCTQTGVQRCRDSFTQLYYKTFFLDALRISFDINILDGTAKGDNFRPSPTSENEQNNSSTSSTSRSRGMKDVQENWRAAAKTAAVQTGSCSCVSTLFALFPRLNHHERDARRQFEGSPSAAQRSVGL